MNEKKIMRIGLVVVLLVWAVLAGCAFFLPKNEYSDSERRRLASFPTLTWETFEDGSFASKFETYAMDQFPLRDSFRSVKAMTQLYVLGQKANNGLYLADGYLVKEEYPFRQSSLDHALNRFQNLYDSYLKESGGKIYVSVVPDKNYFLGASHGYLAMDYSAIFQQVEAGMPYATYVDITDLLSIKDYYYTDTHWRQECILPVANRLAQAMGASASGIYEEKALEQPFYGVYYGQAALPLSGEPLKYLTNEVLENASVWEVQDDSIHTVYNMEKAEGRDPYEMFLSGATPLITVENPQGEPGKELILFRDSFGSSLASLLIEGYEKITLVDIRYMNSSILGDYVDFHGQDVLFLYSTLVLNSSATLK